MSTWVVSVRWSPPPIQAKPAGLDRGDDLGQQGRVAGAPDEARAQHDGLEAVGARGSHRLLGKRLCRRVERLRIRPQGCRLVDLSQRLAGEQRGLGAAMDEAPYARLAAAGERVLRPGDVAGA